MHDLTAAQQILKVVLDAANEHPGRRVVTISVKIGDRMGLEGERLGQLVQDLARGTAAEGAKLEAEIVAGAGLVIDSFEIE